MKNLKYYIIGIIALIIFIVIMRMFNLVDVFILRFTGFGLIFFGFVFTLLLGSFFEGKIIFTRAGIVFWIIGLVLVFV